MASDSNYDFWENLIIRFKIWHNYFYNIELHHFDKTQIFNQIAPMQKCLQKQMISNNKNKTSKELTLQQIIQKSTFRKTIESLCVLEKNINKEPQKQSSLVHTPVELFRKDPAQLKQKQYFGSKKSYESTKQAEKTVKSLVTARTSKSQRQNIANLMMNENNRVNKFKQNQRNDDETKGFNRSKQNKAALLQRQLSSKKKTKKATEYLCVKGGMGKIINCPKPLTAQGKVRGGLIPQYEMKKYQTVVQLGQQIGNKQKSCQFLIPSQQSLDVKKFHSFMLTKYSTSETLRQKIVSSSKSYSHSKLNKNTLLSEQLIKKKIQYRGIKTQERIQQNRVQNVQEIFNPQANKSNKMKKYELILNINGENQIRKNGENQIRKNGENQIRKNGENQIRKQFNKNKSRQQLRHRAQRTIQNTNQFIVEEKNDSQENELEKELCQEDLARTQSKGFKGTKVKSQINYVKAKARYFIPDFIKPSLDLVVFDKKPSQRLSTEQKLQNKNEAVKKSIERDQMEYQVGQCIKGIRLQLNVKQSLPESTEYKLNSCENQIQNQNGEKLEHQEYHSIQKQRDEHQQLEEKKKFKSKKNPPKRKRYHLDAQICGWDQNDMKISQNVLMQQAIQFDF